MDLKDGETTEVQGSGAKPYLLKNAGGAYVCSCAAWRNQSADPFRRTCKHLKKLRGESAEAIRCGITAFPPTEKVEEKEEKNKPPLLLAHSWDHEQDPTGYWISEKEDGVRCYWDGKKATSRQGNEIALPDWYMKDLPKVPVDGELWIKRGDFHRTSGLCRRQDKGDHWKEISLMSFDLPSMKAPFEERYKELVSLVESGGPAHFRYLPQTRCKGMDHLLKMLKDVESKGGEGLMLRQPGSMYVAGRSTTLLKVKSHLEMEAKVVGYTAGKGKYKGLTGALECVLKSGAAFCVSPGPDENRRNPPKVGTIINIHLKELTVDGIPREPTFHGARYDVKW